MGASPEADGGNIPRKLRPLTAPLAERSGLNPHQPPFSSSFSSLSGVT